MSKYRVLVYGVMYEKTTANKSVAVCAGDETYVVPVKVLLEASLDVSLGVVQLLLSDVECSAKWFTAAVKCCLDANMLEVAVALCYLLVPQGKYSQSCLPTREELILKLHLLIVSCAVIFFCRMNAMLPISQMRHEQF